MVQCNRGGHRATAAWRKRVRMFQGASDEGRRVGLGARRGARTCALSMLRRGRAASTVVPGARGAGDEARAVAQSLCTSRTVRNSWQLRVDGRVDGDTPDRLAS